MKYFVSTFRVLRATVRLFKFTGPIYLWIRFQMQAASERRDRERTAERERLDRLRNPSKYLGKDLQ